MKALIELRYIRDYHPEVVNQKVIDEALAELEALESRSCGNCKHYITEYTDYDNHCGRKGMWDMVEMLRCSKDFGCKYWEAKQ